MAQAINESLAEKRLHGGLINRKSVVQKCQRAWRGRHTGGTGQATISGVHKRRKTDPSRALSS